jgi:hypothetical protein
VRQVRLGDQSRQHRFLGGQIIGAHLGANGIQRHEAAPESQVSMIVPIGRRDKQGISIMAAAMRTEVLEHSGRSRYQCAV